MSAEKKKTTSIFEHISELAGLSSPASTSSDSSKCSNKTEDSPTSVKTESDATAKVGSPMVNQTVTMHPATQVPPNYLSDQFAIMRALMVEQAMNAHSAYGPLMLAAAMGQGLPFLPLLPTNPYVPNPAISHAGKTKCTTMTIEDTKIHATSSGHRSNNQSCNQPSRSQSSNETLDKSATCSNTSTSSSTSLGRQAPRFQCPDCSRSYSTFSGLSKHRQFHCSSQLKRQFACKFCNKEYSSLGALKMHIRTHTLPCKCTVCGKAFSRPWLLQGHLRTHTGEKPFRCGHCGRAFADRSNLRAHLQTHSEVKKYKCGSCMKTFSRMSLLNKHESNGCNAAGGDARGEDSGDE